MLMKMNKFIHFVKHDLNFVYFRTDFGIAFDVRAPIFHLTQSHPFHTIHDTLAQAAYSTSIRFLRPRASGRRFIKTTSCQNTSNSSFLVPSRSHLTPWRPCPNRWWDTAARTSKIFMLRSSHTFKRSWARVSRFF